MIWEGCCENRQLSHHLEMEEMHRVSEQIQGMLSWIQYRKSRA